MPCRPVQANTSSGNSGITFVTAFIGTGVRIPAVGCSSRSSSFGSVIFRLVDLESWGLVQSAGSGPDQAPAHEPTSYA
jgi:hypothetical protein